MVSSFFEGTYDNSFSQYDSIYYAVKNQTNENELEKFLQNEMDIFVGIQSILVPVSSPIFGFILDSIQMAFGNVHYAILSGFRAGSWCDRFQRTTESRQRASLPWKSIIYSVLALYSISVFSSLSLIRRVSFVLLSLSRSFGTVGYDKGSRGTHWPVFLSLKIFYKNMVNR